MSNLALVLLLLTVALLGRCGALPVESSPKDGQCPTLGEGVVGICVENCSSDGDCNGTLKCCSNGCGRTCVQPENNTDSQSFDTVDSNECGAMCAPNEKCEMKTIIVQCRQTPCPAGWTGSYQKATCVGPNKDVVCEDAWCPDGYFCVPDGHGEPTCEFFGGDNQQ